MIKLVLLVATPALALGLAPGLAPAARRAAPAPIARRSLFAAAPAAAAVAAALLAAQPAAAAVAEDAKYAAYLEAKAAKDRKRDAAKLSYEKPAQSTACVTPRRQASLDAEAAEKLSAKAAKKPTASKGFEPKEVAEFKIEAKSRVFKGEKPSTKMILKEPFVPATIQGGKAPVAGVISDADRKAKKKAAILSGEYARSLRK